MSRAIHGLLRRRDGINHHLHWLSSLSPVCTPAPLDPFAITLCSSSLPYPSHVSILFLQTQSKLFFPHSFAAKPSSSNGTFSRFFSSSEQNPLSFVIRASRKYCSSGTRPPQSFSSRRLVIPKQGENYAGFRSFSFKSVDFGKVSGGFAKRVIDKPVTAVRSTFSRYSEAIGLQIEAFFKRHYLFLFEVAGVMVCALLGRVMFGIANTFIGLSEGMAKYGFLALSSAIVAFAGLYIRSRFTINHDRVYRMAMTRLNTSAGILEVMGSLLTRTDLIAYVMSRGGLTFKKFKLSIRSKRCFLIFPIKGSERKGLVSVEVKKKKGQINKSIRI